MPSRPGMEDLPFWKKEQDRVRDEVIHEDHDLSFAINEGQISGLSRIAGVDTSFVPETNLAYVAIAVLSFPELKLAHLECHAVEIDVPYIPGYLAFRELPAIKVVAEKLRMNLKQEDWPQLFLVDGNGQMHPRAAGVASHLGVDLGWPTVGVSKSFFRMDGLTAKMVDETVVPKLLERSGSCPVEPIIGQSGKMHGYAMLGGRKKTKNPIFVSVGHRVGLETALAVVKGCSVYRVPEPIRLADKLSRERAQLHILNNKWTSP